MIIKKLGALSVGKVQGVIGAVVGLIVGLVITIIGSVAGGTHNTDVFAGLGAVAIVAAPIFYGVFGFIGGVFFALTYNLVAKWVGGIKIETD